MIGIEGGNYLVLVLKGSGAIDRYRRADIILAVPPHLQLGVKPRVRVRDIAFRFHHLLGFRAS